MHWYVNYPESELLFQPMYNVDFSYPAHLHGCMEVSFCVSGGMTVQLGVERYELCDGQGILVPPNMVHSYQTENTSAYYTILFSRDLMPDFAAMFSHKQPLHCVFSVDDRLNRHLQDFYGSDRTIFGGKSLLYHMAENFLRGNEFRETDKGDDDLTMQIITYIQDNLSSEITLQDMADHLGYSYYYISKRIRQVFQVPFTELLAQYRVADVKLRLDAGKCTISQAALASGFGSIRTFNRIFHRLTGLTPSQYLSQPSHMEILNLEEP